jgi:uncharacterized protein YkwD
MSGAQKSQHPRQKAGHDASNDAYRNVWRAATPAQRLQKLQELISFARRYAGAAARVPKR